MGYYGSCKKSVNTLLTCWWKGVMLHNWKLWAQPWNSKSIFKVFQPMTNNLTKESFNNIIASLWMSFQIIICNSFSHGL